MRFAYIPQTDLYASAICFGTAQIGSKLDEAASFRLLDLYVELGGNLVDSSHNYADWACAIKSVSEKTIGKWMKLRKNRGQMIVSTKGACPEPNGRFFRLGRDDIMSDLNSSLSNLQTDCIDMYWLHRDDPFVSVGQILEPLLEAVDAGKIRYFACSNWTLARIQEVQRLAEAKGRQGFSASQVMWSLAKPNQEQLSDKTIVVMDEETKAYHANTRMAVFPFSSQAGGFFGGKYGRKSQESHTQSAVGKIYFNDTNFSRLERVQQVAARLDTTPNAVALAWLFAHPFAIFPIVGPHSEDQLIDSCIAGELRLDEATARYIETGLSSSVYP